MQRFGKVESKSSVRSFRRAGKAGVAAGIEFLKPGLIIGGLAAPGLLFHSGGDKLCAKLLFASPVILLAVYVVSRIYRGRIFFPTHRATVFFDILTSLRFTCMYGGVRFRLHG